MSDSQSNSTSTSNSSPQRFAFPTPPASSLPSSPLTSPAVPAAEDGAVFPSLATSPTNRFVFPPPSSPPPPLLPTPTPTLTNSASAPSASSSSRLSVASSGSRRGSAAHANSPVSAEYILAQLIAANPFKRPHAASNPLPNNTPPAPFQLHPSIREEIRGVSTAAGGGGSRKKIVKDRRWSTVFTSIQSHVRHKSRTGQPFPWEKTPVPPLPATFSSRSRASTSASTPPTVSIPTPNRLAVAIGTGRGRASTVDVQPLSPTSPALPARPRNSATPIAAGAGKGSALSPPPALPSAPRPKLVAATSQSGTGSLRRASVDSPNGTATGTGTGSGVKQIDVNAASPITASSTVTSPTNAFSENSHQRRHSHSSKVKKGEERLRGVSESHANVDSDDEDRDSKSGREDSTTSNSGGSSSASGGTTAPPLYAPTAAGQTSEIPLTEEEKTRKRKEHKHRIAVEILTTERSYVATLDSLIKLYVTPMHSVAWLTESEHRQLFSNVELIHSFNTKFLSDLEERMAKWNEEEAGRIGALFLQYSPFLKMYSQYVTNHEFATKILQKLEKESSEFTKFAAKAVLETPFNHHLQSLLIGPIQRVPRYELLLTALVKYTDPTHIDYNNLTKALTIVTAVAAHVNEHVKKMQSSLQLLTLQNLFVEKNELNLLNNSKRYFVKQGTLTKKGRYSDVQYEFFLFSDLLIYASNTLSGKYKIHRKLNWQSDGLSVLDIPDTDVDHNCMQLNSRQKSFVCLAQTQHQKVEWMKAFNEVQNQTPQQMQHPPPMLRENSLSIMDSSGESVSTEPNSFFDSAPASPNPVSTPTAFLSMPSLSNLHSVTSSSSSSLSSTSSSSSGVPEFGSVRPLMAQFRSGACCHCCNKALGALNRHWCEACGSLVCNSCSGQEVLLKWNAKLSRVCEKCVLIVKEERVQKMQKETMNRSKSATERPSEDVPNSPSAAGASAPPPLPARPGPKPALPNRPSTKSTLSPTATMVPPKSPNAAASATTELIVPPIPTRGTRAMSMPPLPQQLAVAQAATNAAKK